MEGTAIRFRIDRVENGWIARFGGYEVGECGKEFIGPDKFSVKGAAMIEVNRLLDNILFPDGAEDEG